MLKRISLALALAVPFGLGLVSSVQAGPVSTIGFDPTGSSHFTQIDTLNVLPGNALAIGGNTATSAGSGTFQTLFQASLNNAALGNNTVVQVNPNLQITVVAAFQESVSLATHNATQGVASFNFASGGLDYLRLYAGTPGTANDYAGTGFTAGPGQHLILDATITGKNFTSSFTSNFDSGSIQNFDNASAASGGNKYPGISSVTGSGSTSLTATINSFDSHYFSGLTVGAQISEILNSSKLLAPFVGVQPSKQFTEDGGATIIPNIGTVDGLPLGLAVPQGVGGPDIQFETQATAQFLSPTAVPEPATLALFGIGAATMGLGTCLRRKLRKS